MHVLTNAEKLIPLRDAASLAESRRLAGMRMVTGTTSPSTRYERISVSPASCSIKSEYVIASHAFKPQYKCINYTPAWEQRKLGELVDNIDTGRSVFCSESYGRYPVLGSTSVIGSDSSYDYEGAFLLTARVGANAGNLYRFAGKVKISDNTVFLQAPNSDFLFYLLGHFDLRKLSFGTGQPLVRASELRAVEIDVPKLENEQKSIAEFFDHLDSLITLHQRKRQWLKWLDEGGEGTHHDIDILVFKFADDMKISVLCGVHACMTKSLGHTGNRYAGKQQQRGMGVP